MQTVSCFRPMTQDISSPRIPIVEMNKTAKFNNGAFKAVKISDNQSISSYKANQK